MKPIIYLLIALSLTSCFNSQMDDDYTYIDPILKPYLDKFLEEAEAYHMTQMSVDNTGFNFNLKHLKLSFGILHGPGGVTYFNTNMIVIDSTTLNWKKNPEEVVFHEFGHLFLHRGHDNDTMIEIQNGNIIAKSIMNESASIKYSNDPAVKRPYYIQELFNSSTPKPAWAR